MNQLMIFLLFCSLISLGANAIAQESFEGELIHVIEDYEKHHIEYQALKDSSGKIKRLENIPESVLKRLEKLPSGSKITVSGALKDGALSTENVEISSARVAEDLEQRPHVYQSGSRSVLVIGVNFNSNSYACGDETNARKVILDPSDPLSTVSYYSNVSEGAFSLTGDFASVTINVDLSTSNSCDQYAWADLAEAALRAKGIEPDDFDHQMYLIPPGASCGWAGSAFMGANQSWVKSCNPKTIAHELGHNFGLHHAASESYEYGDNSDIMGGSFKEFNAPKRAKIGFVDSTRINNISLSGSHDLAPLNQASNASTTPQILKIPTAVEGVYYYLSYRDATGVFDKDLSSSYVNKLNIHRFDDSKAYGLSYFVGAIGQGQSFPLQDLGGYLKVDELTSGQLTFSIHDGEIPTCSDLEPTVSSLGSGQKVTRGSTIKAQLKIFNNSSAACDATSFSYYYTGTMLVNVGSAKVTYNSSSPNPLIVPAQESRTVDFELTVANDAELGTMVTWHSVSIGSTAPGFRHFFYVVESTGSDTTAPSVSISSPSEGAEFDVGSTVSASMSASDNVGVTSVRLYVNGALKCTDSTSPYSCSFAMIEGDVQLKAIASDAAGNTKSVLRNIKSKAEVVDTTAPSVSITSPSASAEVEAGSAVVVTLSASDNIGVTNTRVYLNGSLQCSDSSAPYSCSVVIPEGSNHILMARAYDAAGNFSSDSQAISGKNTTIDTQAPTVPANLVASKKGKSNVDLSFSASTDNVGVSEYRIYKDGSLLTSTTSTSYTDSKVSGSHSYYVIAVDAAGNKSAASNTASITMSSGSSPGGGKGGGKGKK